MRPRADALSELLAAGVDAEGAEALSALGGRPLVVVPVEDAQAVESIARELRPGAPILVGVDQRGAAPDGLGDLFDVLLTTQERPPAPWVGAGLGGMEAALAEIEATVVRCPVASAVFATVLRIADGLDFDAALAVESLAYSTLLGGREFKAWRTGRPARKRPEGQGPQVRIERQDEVLVVTLVRPERRNAVGAQLRDELTAALRLARLDPGLRVELRGEGPVFSAGGDLEEFGQAGDLALAHIIRTQRSPARLATELGERLRVFIQGAAIGGGIEIAAAAGQVTADPGAVFRLPEVGMGLIPGAGGTVSLPRRIGRHRACFMGLTARDIEAGVALDWGLVDRVAAV